MLRELELIKSLFKPLRYEKKSRLPCDRRYQNLKILPNILKMIFIKYFSHRIFQQ